jgi:hypothetical protein
LLEVVCVVALVAILAAIVVPALPRGTSRARLESFAIEAAAMLKADRDAAIRNRVQVATEIDAPLRLVRSGATGRVIRMPADVRFDALLAARCNNRPAGPDHPFLRVRHVVRRDARADAARRRLSGARQLADRRCRVVPFEQQQL